MIRVVGYLVLGLASGLEAFSREPPCDSVGALAARQTPETSGMAWEFLSYYPILPSRYLRDPLAIPVKVINEKIFFGFIEQVLEVFSEVMPSIHNRSGPKDSPYCALRAYFSQFPAK